MLFSSDTYPLKIHSIRQHVGGLKHPLRGYSVVFLGLVPWSDFPSVHGAEGQMAASRQATYCCMESVCQLVSLQDVYHLAN